MRFKLAVPLLAATAGTALAHTPEGVHDSVQLVGHQISSPHHLPGIILITVLLLALPIVRAWRRR